ncbi:MAG TPA: hypothetical protein VFO65_09485 [Acidimicrobiales bacterium]|nr:hypothetical protein [Acidimicrobiales bacterium]
MSEPEEQIVADEVVERARAFVFAVAWGEHVTVWDLLSTGARRTVLEVAVKRGMDEAQAERLGGGTAGATERDLFLTDLVNGLRADLEGNNLDALDYDRQAADGGDPNMVTVVMSAPMVAGLGSLPVGSVEMVREGADWRVERILPLGSRPT